MSDAVATYTALPWQIDAWSDTSETLLATGAAGGGKSHFAAEKVHGYMLRYPGAVGAIGRRARQWASKTVVPMMQRIMGPQSGVRYNKSELTFYYPNGSRIYIFGMKDADQREAIRSHEFDIVWMEEATQFSEIDFQELAARLRGTAASWRQIILTTNPGGPLHWIKRRLIDGQEAAVYFSSASDNIDHLPGDYMGRLDRLTGVQHQRLVLGRWVQAEGVIFDNWSDEPWPAGNVCDVKRDEALQMEWYIDDGYSPGAGEGSASYHPRVILVAQVRADGGVDLIDEYVVTGELSAHSIQEVLGWYGRPDIAFVDSSASELRAQLTARGIMNAPASHPVSEGIKVMRHFIDDGQHRLLRVSPNCRNFLFEISSYQYGAAERAVAGERRPLKVNDHSMDACRYGLYPKRFDVLAGAS